MCNEEEMVCSGRWNEAWTEQLSPDFCIPMKEGDCWNVCPMDCGQNVMCPGGTDHAGCKNPDVCLPEGSVCAEPAVYAK